MFFFALSYIHLMINQVAIFGDVNVSGTFNHCITNCIVLNIHMYGSELFSYESFEIFLDIFT